MKGEYIAHRDPGDENDFFAKQAERQALREYIGLDDDPEFNEQIAIALRVVDQADTLPESMVTYCRNLLHYWGIVESPVEDSTYGETRCC